MVDDPRENSEHPSNVTTLAREERDAKTVTYLDDLFRGTPGSLRTTMGKEVSKKPSNAALSKHNGTMSRMGLSGVSFDNDTADTTNDFSTGSRTHPVYPCNALANDCRPNEIVYESNKGLSDTHETANVS